MAQVLRSGKPLIFRVVQAPLSRRRVVSCSVAALRAVNPASTVPLSGQSQLFCSGRNVLMATALFGSSSTATKGETPYDFSVKDIDGREVDLSKYRGKVILVVNVASQCGFTPQYKELGELYNRYQGQGFVILGFPCNQFGGQEPADNNKIKQFAAERGAKFPMMAKVDVNGSNADPFYSFLKKEQSGLIISDIKWNFTKFLINKEGKVVKRYGSATTPMSIEKDIKGLL